MNKNVIKFLSVTEYITLIAATVAVLAAQFLPYLILMIIGIGCYVASFFVASVRAVLNCVEIFSASKRVVGEQSALVTSSKVEVLNSKKEMVLAVLNCLLWISLFAFALVVLIMYPKTI